MYPLTNSPTNFVIAHQSHIKASKFNVFQIPAFSPPLFLLFSKATSECMMIDIT